MNLNKEQILQQCNAITKNTLMETLQIEFIDFTETTLTAKMPVNSRVHQPDGVLHGGASVALAESVGSACAIVFLGDRRATVRGIEISANHVRSIKNGFVTAEASIIHMGRTTQLWQIKILNPEKELISLVKLTTITI